MKLSKIAEILNETYHGEDVDIDRLGSLSQEKNFNNEILYIESGKYLKKAITRNPAALVMPGGLDAGGIPFIEVKDPKLVFVKLLNIFNPFERINSGIDANARIHSKTNIGANVTIMAGSVIMEGARIDADCIIYPNCVIEKNCIVGANTILYPCVVIRERCIVGNDCIIHPGTVIGADGYGFYEKEGKIIKIPQIGIVRIGHRVEIGANCTLDRATIDKTEIGNDTKIDNLVHIAHNVKIGEKCYIAAQAGISGSVIIGNHAIILGQAGIADHVSISDNTIIMPQSGIPGDVKKTEVLFGTPARPVKEHHRIFASLKYLPELLKRIKRLEDIIDKK